MLSDLCRTAHLVVLESPLCLSAILREGIKAHLSHTVGIGDVFRYREAELEFAVGHGALPDIECIGIIRIAEIDLLAIHRIVA